MSMHGLYVLKLQQTLIPGGTLIHLDKPPCIFAKTQKRYEKVPELRSFDMNPLDLS
jgi:hypothetical protein